jgi:arylsulfatase A-like enzyme
VPRWGVDLKAAHRGWAWRTGVALGFVVLGSGCAESAAQGPPGPNPAAPVVLRERLMEGRAQLELDPAYQDRPFRGLVRHRVGADVYGKSISGKYVASLFDEGEPSVFDIRRAWLLRGATRVHVPQVEVRAGDLLAFSLGRLRPVLQRGALRPDCSLAIDVKDESGRSLLQHRIPLRTELESNWLERRVPLDAAAGHSVNIDLRLDGFWCSSEDHALLGDFQLYAHQAPAKERPNVLVIWVDKLRADLANPDTAIPGHMPFLQGLARKGVLFTQARANSSNTFRSTVQALTSDPNSEAIAGENFATSLAAPMGIPSLPSVLGSAGYHTTCLGANIHIARVPDGAARRQVDLGFDRCSIDYRTIPGDNDDARIEREQLIPWLDAEVSEPFFLNLHYDGAHEPYPEVDRKNPPKNFASYLSRGQGDPQAALYLYKAELFDHVLEDTWGRLEAKGLLDRTLVIIASDHGSTLGPDHRFFMFGRFHDIRATHAGGLYDEQIRTLLLFLHPRLSPALRNESVQLLDLAPTILDFLGIAPPTQFAGRSRREALFGGAALDNEPMYLGKEQEFVYGLYDPPYKYTYWLKPQERWRIDPSYVPGWNLNKVDDSDHGRFERQITQYRAKGMPISDPELVVSELFDVETDPRELNNLVATRPELAQAFQARIEKSILNQRVPEYALDEARETLAFVSPERAVFEGSVESDGPLKLSTPLAGCDPWQVEQRDLNTIQFRCGAATSLSGITFYRRAQAELRFTIRRDGVLLSTRDYFLGPDGLPTEQLSTRGDAVVLTPSAQPSVSPRTPEVVRERDRGAFVYRQLRSAGADEDVGQGELNRAFAAWGYRQ